MIWLGLAVVVTGFGIWALLLQKPPKDAGEKQASYEADSSHL